MDIAVCVPYIGYTLQIGLTTGAPTSAIFLMKFQRFSVYPLPSLQHMTILSANLPLISNRISAGYNYMVERNSVRVFAFYFGNLTSQSKFSNITHCTKGGGGSLTFI
jgi:hypothetical protein